jgi:formate dehydrogenase major subunit
MVPYKDGGANEGHSCVKGRFAWGYATHPDRVTTPMVRDAISDEWREVSWDEAIGFAADKIKSIQSKFGTNSVGAITSSRCTNEEVFVVQKLVRTAFGNNNVDTCAKTSSLSRRATSSCSSVPIPPMRIRYLPHG